MFGANTSKILINHALIDNFEQFILNLLRPCKILIISDSNVAKLYVEQVKSQLKKFNFQAELFIIDGGEKAKSLKTVEKIYEVLSLNFMSRSDLIISLGGGVVTDIAGFVAATYNRGMKLVSIPTSFLAMIDAAIGGKNGVNSNYGKNLIGTFYHPSLILIDPNVLKTLPKNELYCGIAEAIKYGCIKDKKLFEILEKENFENNLDEIIHRSILVKKELVEKDEFDLDERMLLNFGHTIGHALEKLYNYEKISHGEAVAIGMNKITKISEIMNLTEKGTTDRLLSVCKKYSLPTESDLPFKEIFKIIMRDKKVIDNYLNLILLKNIGNGFIYKIPSEKIMSFMKKEKTI